MQRSECCREQGCRVYQSFGEPRPWAVPGIAVSCIADMPVAAETALPMGSFDVVVMK